ncbi:MAG: replicative DNA helicase [Verrucomicrobiota bacterium]
MIAHSSETFPKSKSEKKGIQLDGLNPIQSMEAERAVLGAMLSQPDEIIDLASEKLTSTSFFSPAHQSLFECLCDMRNKSIEIDPSTVLQYLKDRKLDEAIGGAATLGELAGGVMSILTAPTQIRTVWEKSILRKLQSACTDIVFSTQEREHAVEEVLDEAEKLIFEIADQGTSNTTSASKDVVIKTLEMIERTMQMRGRYDGLPTGFDPLDQLTTGFKPGEMIVIAARPGMGKTALALSIAKNMLKSRYDVESDRIVSPGYPIGMFSLEMTCQQLMLRLLAATAEVSLQNIRKGNLSQNELDKLAIISEEVSGWPLYMDESSMLSISQLRAKARRMKKMYGIEIIIIDYLQLLTSSSAKARDNRQVEVAEISRGLKALALELNIPIIVLAQLNRKPDESKDGEPALHHLRESGSIEQDADIVMLLSRNMKGSDDGDGAPIDFIPAKLNIAKQRNGPVDSVNFIFKGRYAKFEVAPREAK